MMNVAPAPGFSRRVETLCKQLGSVNAVYKATGVHRATINRWLEQDDVRPRTDQLTKFIRGTKCDREWLIFGESGGSGRSSRVEEESAARYGSSPSRIAENPDDEFRGVRGISDDVSFPSLEIAVPLTRLFAKLMTTSQLGLAISEVAVATFLNEEVRRGVIHALSEALQDKPGPERSGSGSKATSKQHK